MARAAATSSSRRRPRGVTGPEIVSTSGKVIWFHSLPPGSDATDFRVQTYLGKPVLTRFQMVNGVGCGWRHLHVDRPRVGPLPVCLRMEVGYPNCDGDSPLDGLRRFATPEESTSCPGKGNIPLAAGHYFPLSSFMSRMRHLL